MKRLVVLSALFIIVYSFCDAQYMDNLYRYDYRSYKYQRGDPYHPAGAAIASFFIPGLGQMICGAGGRGAAFLTGWLGGFGMVFAGMYLQANTGEGTDGMGLVYLGLGFSIVSWLWSTGDAVRVAKVNNMAFRDRKVKDAKFTFSPIFRKMEYNNKNNLKIVGLSFTARF